MACSMLRLLDFLVWAVAVAAPTANFAVITVHSFLECCAMCIVWEWKDCAVICDMLQFQSAVILKKVHTNYGILLLFLLYEFSFNRFNLFDSHFLYARVRFHMALITWYYLSILKSNER